MKIPLAASLLLTALASTALAGGGQSHGKRDELARLPVVQPTGSCSSLSAIDLTTIGGAGSRVVTAQQQVTDSGVAICAVEGVLAPSIGFKVELPTQTWTQRYLQVGCGGLCGRISLNAPAAEGCVPLEADRFVVASTDMGHQDSGGAFGTDPQKRADFAHRGVHLTALASKALIEAFYGQQPAHSYFSGCSDGGREALVEAQRYPDDFDGIVAGAPAMNFQVQNSLLHGWQAQVNKGPNGQAVLVASRLPLLHQAVLAQCDGLDGQLDGLLTDPRACQFDPATIQCADDESTSQCLTAAEVQTVQKIYSGPVDVETGERLAVGGPQPGSELAWAGVFVPETADGQLFSETIALDALRYLTFEQPAQPDFTLDQLTFTAETFDRLRARHPLFDSTNPDLSAFARQGGKLILWHGWSDNHISPINTIAYHEALQRYMGQRQVNRFERLYLVPGMYHCSGGEGPSEMDLLTPVMRWVETGQAPDEIMVRAEEEESTTVATQAKSKGKAHGKPVQAVEGRPVYPYPYVARYIGRGHSDNGGHYKRGAPLTNAPTPSWRGSDFYTPYPPREL
ncbi:tannase [Stutzerimonas stutzeri]|uniref:Tannase n=1 Tax=Stutzerimonas stutzeri TaxID=316 RepID=W8R2R1_STUST|nr:tannase/feruloyl esterase family alpha/beta hydrolase [Stutzerimonas stutzeri]AHL76894.1 tannase [Stutzerimonas stutzeri]MCQ4331079.1 tannase/feruloyl esterase family alpha/beta hydrolase [Stutzerimonas stutzeri]